MFLSNWGILPPLLVCWEFYHLLVLDFVKVPFSASVNMIIRLFFFILLMWKNILIFFLMLNHTCISSVQFSRSVMSDSLWPHESQHARPPCPSPTPRVHPDSRPSSQWCHPDISSSLVPFSSHPQSLPEKTFKVKSWFSRHNRWRHAFQEEKTDLNTKRRSSHKCSRWVLANI